MPNFTLVKGRDTEFSISIKDKITPEKNGREDQHNASKIDSCVNNYDSQ